MSEEELDFRMRGGYDTRLWIVLLSSCALGCGDSSGSGLMEPTAYAARSAVQTAAAPAPISQRAAVSARAGTSTTSTSVASAEPLVRVAPTCPDPILHFEDGALRGHMCPAEARARGLVVVDLSDTWTPAVLGPGPRYVAPDHDDSALLAMVAPAAAANAPRMPEARAADGPPDASPPASGEVMQALASALDPAAPAETVAAPDYRQTFIALANERFGAAGADGKIAREDRHLELYGIFPTLSVLAPRLAEDARHACHAALDDAPLAALDRTLREEDVAMGYKRVQQTGWLRQTLERARARGGHDTLEELAASNPYYRRQVARLARLETTVQAITAAEAHLVCEGLLEERRVDGVLDWRTANALAVYNRKHFVVARGQLTRDSSAVLAMDSRELDFRAALRVLRERVVDATGIIEDGSALGKPEPILGRVLDPELMHTVPGHEPLAGGAPDLVARATEAAARHLGWTDFQALRRFLDIHAAGAGGQTLLRVALDLPEVPDYYSEHMDLRVDIDRGDVWYDVYPRWRPVERRPALILRVVVGDRSIPLVRWPTTIGGWEKERRPNGALVYRYKNSDVGPRVWRELYAAPAWLPPPTTPDRELVRRRWNGSYELKRDVFGPGYRSAYGLAMFIHHQVVPVRDGERFDDNGVRTHGSVSYTTIDDGTSHGCHRLFNHHALRLASFALHHRAHRRHGEEKVFYDRIVNQGGRHALSLRSRGYRYEMVPPIPVMVGEGRIRSRRKQPPH